MVPWIPRAEVWAASCRRRRGARGHGERSRLQLLCKQAGTEYMLTLAVNVLAVDCPLRPPPLYSVKTCLYILHSVQRAALRALRGFRHPRGVVPSAPSSEASGWDSAAR